MTPCPQTADGLVNGLVDTVDCHIRVLVQESYRNLVGPDTVFAAAFTGLLTLYIALVGYQLLLGRGGLRVTDLPVTALKIGLILAFMTSWAAYQTVFFDLLFDGPREVLAAMLAPMARAGYGFDGDVYSGLERAYRGLSGAASSYGAMAAPSANILQGGPMLGSGLLWLSSIVMLLATIGFILAAKIVLAFLLAVGPVFVGLFLFESTRGFFDGWLRTTVSFALMPLAANVFGAAMLLMLAPFLVTLQENAAQARFDMGPIITIALIVAVFCIVIVMSVRVGAGIASGFNTHAARRRDRDAELPASSPGAPLSPERVQERAEETAARAALADRAGYGGGGDSGRRTGTLVDAVSDERPPAEARLGQSWRPPAQPAPRRGEGL